MNLIRQLLGSVFLAAAVLQPAAAQHSITGMIKTPTNLALAWQTSAPPYLVQTSSNLVDWCDQDALVSTATVVNASLRSGAFYRVAYLNSTGHLGRFFGLIELEQAGLGSLTAMHRLKSRWWLYKPKGVLSKVPATFFGKLFVYYQHIEDNRVTTFAGPLESMGTATTSDRFMEINWGRDDGDKHFTLTLEFPYSATNSRAAEPLPSDPYYTLRCIYKTPQPEFNSWEKTMNTTFTDLVSLVQMPSRTNSEVFWDSRKYSVMTNGAEIDFEYLVGFPLYQGGPGPSYMPLILAEWTAPATGGGGSLPPFSTQCYFALTLFPGHHNYFEEVLLAPALDPALSDAARAALRTGNIRYIYTFKDHNPFDPYMGFTPDDIRYLGYDNSIRKP